MVGQMLENKKAWYDFHWFSEAPIAALQTKSHGVGNMLQIQGATRNMQNYGSSNRWVHFYTDLTLQFVYPIHVCA